MSNQVIYIIRAIDRATRPLQNVGRSAMAMARNITTAGAAMKKMGYHFTSLRGIISATYGAAMVAFPIKKATDFESKMIDIKRVTDFKPGGLAKFQEFLIQMGIHLGKIPSDMADIGYEISKFTPDTTQLEKYVELAAKISASFDIAGKDAAEQIGKISAKMGFNAKGMEGFLDAVNYAADRSATSVKNQLQIIARVSTNLQGMKLPPNLAAGWANFADKLKATPRTAAKGLEMFLRDISKMRGGYRRLLKPGADVNKILMTFLEKLKKMPEISRNMRIDKIFGTRTADFIKKAVNRLDELKKSMDLVTDSKFVGSMERELIQKLKSAKTALDRVNAIFQTIAITVGNAFLPLIKELSPIIVKLGFSFREFVRSHPMLIKIVMGVIALVTVLTGATIVIGLLAIAFGTLMSPITLIILGVMAIVGLLGYLYMKSESVKQAFGFLVEPLTAVWGQLSRIFEMLFGKSLDSKAIFGGVFWFLENVATVIIGTLAGAFNILMIPIRVVLFLIEQLVSLFTNLDTYITKFAGFADSISKGLGSGLSGIGDFFSGAGSATANYMSSKLQNVNVDGGIEVSASPGSEIVKTKFDKNSAGNLGFNMGGL